MSDTIDMTADFKPALIVVDLQEDFCPPNGSLAVPGGRDVVAPINELLALPSFVVRVATKDWHPTDHISFASNHAGKRAFEDTATVVNPRDASERYETRLWPVHCVQGTPGAELARGLARERIDAVVEKGTDPRFEMYGAFHDPFTTTTSTTSSSPRLCDTGLASLLRARGTTDVYVVGLAGDYCVRTCAEDAAKEGFRTYLIEECTRPVDADGWARCKRELEEGSGSRARVVSMDSPEVRRLGMMTTTTTTTTTSPSA